MCAQHDTVAESKKCHIVTCVCVNAIRTILQFTFVTHGHLFTVTLGATKGTYIPIITHNILIIIVLLCRCSPYMCRYVFPRTTWSVPFLSSNQKLLQMQEYTHALKHTHCESLAPTRGATQQSVDSEIVPVSSIALEGWGPKEGGNRTPPLHSPGSPNKGGTKSEVKTSARGHHDALRGP